MLDMKWVRENRPALEKMLSDRRSKLDVAPLYTLDTDRRKILGELEQLQAERNKSADQIGRVKAQKGDVATLLKDVETKKDQIKTLEAKLAKIEPPLNDLLLRINNIPDKSVPVGASAEQNKVVREVGKVVPEIPFAVTVAAKAFTAKEPDLVVRFIRALGKSMQLIKTNGDRAIQLAVAGKLRSNLKTQRRALNYFAQDLDVDIERENIIAVLSALGIKGEPERFFDRTYLTAAMVKP